MSAPRVKHAEGAIPRRREDQGMTPNELASELRISSKRLRNWLRREFPRSSADRYQRWTLDARMIEAARQAFRK
jgi:hypothetical protein